MKPNTKHFKALYKEEYGYSTLNIYIATKNGLGQHIAELNQELVDDTIDNKIEKLLEILLESIQENLQTATLFSNSKFDIEYKNPKTGHLQKYVVANDYLVIEFGKRFIEVFNKATPITTYKLVFTEEKGVSKLDILMMDQTSVIKNMGYISDELVAPAVGEKIDKLLIKFVDSVQLGHRAKALFQNSQIKIVIKNTETGTETPYKVVDDKLIMRFKYNALTLI
jgi:hypothetical protein